MDLSKVNKKALIKDLVFFGTFNFVAHILMNMRYNDPLLSEKFIYSLAFVLIGITVYHVFVEARLEKSL
jgi:hypothetical protein